MAERDAQAHLDEASRAAIHGNQNTESQHRTLARVHHWFAVEMKKILDTAALREAANEQAPDDSHVCGDIGSCHRCEGAAAVASPPAINVDLENQRRQLDALGLLGEFAPSCDVVDHLGEALLRARAGLPDTAGFEQTRETATTAELCDVCEPSLLAFVQKIAAERICEDEGESQKCCLDSGAFCGHHLFDDWIVKEARAALAAHGSRPAERPGNPA